MSDELLREAIRKVRSATYVSDDMLLVCAAAESTLTCIDDALARDIKRWLTQLQSGARYDAALELQAGPLLQRALAALHRTAPPSVDACRATLTRPATSGCPFCGGELVRMTLHRGPYGELKIAVCRQCKYDIHPWTTTDLDELLRRPAPPGGDASRAADRAPLPTACGKCGTCCVTVCPACSNLPVPPGGEVQQAVDVEALGMDIRAAVFGPQMSNMSTPVLKAMELSLERVLRDRFAAPLPVEPQREGEK